MIVQIKLFAIAKQIVGSDTFEIETEVPIRIAEIRDRMLAAHPRLGDIFPHVRFAVNAAYVNNDKETLVTENDEVALIPPVSGG